MISENLIRAEEHLNAMRHLKETTDEIPMTKEQRDRISRLVYELGDIFERANGE